jgi:hypothetical protein
MHKLFSGQFAPALAALLLASQAQANSPANDTLQKVRDYAEPSRLVGQVTSVTQFTDVQPTDWAYQALKSLVERYGCIVGYPDQTYRGNRPLSRYEFAAGLNACIDKVMEATASKEDLEALQRLTTEFQTELASLRGRVDALEARATQLEAIQFSTTTKLKGLVVMNVGGINSNTAEVSPYANFFGIDGPAGIDLRTRNAIIDVAAANLNANTSAAGQAASTATAVNTSNGPFAITGQSSLFAPSGVFLGSPAINSLTTATTSTGDSYDLTNPASRAVLRTQLSEQARFRAIVATYTALGTLSDTIRFVNNGEITGLFAPRSLSGTLSQFFNTTNQSPIPGLTPTLNELTPPEQLKAFQLSGSYLLNPLLATVPKIIERTEAEIAAGLLPDTPEVRAVALRREESQNERNQAAAGLTGYTGNGFFFNQQDFSRENLERVGTYTSYVQAQIDEQRFAYSVNGTNLDQNNLGVLAFSRFVDRNLGNGDGVLNLSEAQKLVRRVTEAPVPRKAAVTMDNVAFITLATSFSGKDSLVTQAIAANLFSYGARGGGTLRGDIIGFPGGNLSYDGSSNNNFILYKLYYKFPTGRFRWTVGTQFDVADALPTLASFYPAELMEFFNLGGNNLLYPDASGTGFGTTWEVNPNWNLSLNYITFNGSFARQVPPGITEGLFGDDYQLTAQLAYQSNSGRFQAALGYAYRNSSAFGADTGTQRALFPFGPRVKTWTNNIGLNLAYALSPQFNISGSYGYAWAGSPSKEYLLGVPMVGGPTGASAGIMNWSIGLGFSDVFVKGNSAGIGVGQLPYVVSNASGWGTDAAPTAVEAWYKFQVTDNISVMPGLYYISNSNVSSLGKASQFGAMSLRQPSNFRRQTGRIEGRSPPSRDNRSDAGQGLGHHHAAVDVDHLAGDVACCGVGGQKAHEARHVFRFTITTQGDELEQLFAV